MLTNAMFWTMTLTPQAFLVLQAWRRGTRLLGFMMMVLVVLAIVYVIKKIVSDK